MTVPLQMSAPESGGRRALAIAIMALACTLMLPAVGLALSVFGIVVAIRDLRALHAARQRTGLATGAVVISSLALMLGAIATFLQFYLSAELTAYVECRKGAGTVEAQKDCSDQLMRRSDQLIRKLEKRLGLTSSVHLPSPLFSRSMWLPVPGD